MNEHTSQTDRTHNILLTIISIATAGALIESITQGWEFWVPPLIICGLVACWALHVTHYGKSEFRETYYLVFSMLVSFYHGVHETSFFDVAVVTALLMCTMTLLRRKAFLLLPLLEFFALMAIQTVWAVLSGNTVFDALVISRIILHLVAVYAVYKVLCEVIRSNRRAYEKLEKWDEERKSDKTKMEDFLVNISHELRTPVNVINGMSLMILKKEDREDVVTIRDAGMRLSRQIEDIQDYSEIERGDVVLEEDRYMITSLLNDIVVDYRKMEMKKKLELVVDLDPNIPCMMRGDVRKIEKIIRHLLDNSVKFTRKGGIYVCVSGSRRDYGINLCVEVMDTGIGMKKKEIDRVSKGIYQANRKRNRSTGGIGLGFPIVYGFVRKMGGFVTVESEVGKGTAVRFSIAQEILDPKPCLGVPEGKFIDIAFHVFPSKYKIAAVREFYQTMATNMAAGLRINLYSAPGMNELKRLLDRGDITHIFMGEEEYNAAPAFFEELSAQGMIVVVSAGEGFAVSPGSSVIVMPKPLYGYPVARILNGDLRSTSGVIEEQMQKPILDNLRTLIVDDEPMNLVVASGLFRGYNMIVDTAESGKESIQKFAETDYDVIFMDHMMPGMDGVEAMKRLRDVAEQKGKSVCIIALTANAISGAREMFLREGFDGFISKPIQLNEFERTMSQVMQGRFSGKGGRA